LPVQNELTCDGAKPFQEGADVKRSDYQGDARSEQPKQDIGARAKHPEAIVK